MAYIPKLVGQDEKLVCIARLHWIYVIRGLLAFGCCALLGWVLTLLLYQGLDALTRMLGRIDPVMPLAAVGGYLMPFMLGTGVILFSFYLIKYIATEIGLTSRRVLRKEGLLLTKVHQVDIEEIHGEKLDLGWFGRIFGYGYLNLDCRFIGDIRTPAIENPEEFLKALHKIRSDITDSLAMVGAKTEAGEIPDAPDKAPAETIKAPKPGEDLIQVPGQEPQPQQPASLETPIMPSPAARQSPAILAPPPTAVTTDPMLIVAQNPPGEPPAQPVPAQPQTPVEIPAEPMPAPELPPNPVEIPPHPIETPAEPAPVDPETVAQIVEQVVPQMVEKIASEIAASGLVAQPDLPKQEDDDLLSIFDSARARPATDQDKQHPALQ